MKALGGILIGLGLVWLASALAMDTTVATYSSVYNMPSGRVHNIGKMELRRTHLMLSGGMILVGTILMGFGSLRRDEGVDDDDVDDDLRSCPHCAELVQVEAVYCRHCKRDIPALANDTVGEGNFEDDAGVIEDDPEPESEPGVRHSYRDLRAAAEAAESGSTTRN
jgi:hypothetical protein